MATTLRNQATKKNAKESAEPAKRAGTAIAVKKAIERFEGRLASEEEIKLADYVRLLQLQKEMSEDGPKEVTVRWVDPWAKPFSTEK